MSEEKVDYGFDYRRLNDDHKTAAAEISEIIEKSGNKELADYIRMRFELKSIPIFDISNSQFVKEVGAAGIKVNIQGYIHDIDETGSEIKFPMILISEDIRKLDSFIEKLIK